MIAKPYYMLLILLLVFIFLWYFFGGKEVEFIGIKPLNPEKEEYIERINITQPPLCVDITPTLPEEYKAQTCPNNKFLSKGEKICRETMEKIFGVPFKNTRPNWLKNNLTGRCLELDCYNEELKLAVEYNGQSHYLWPNYLNQTYDTFQSQVKRDELKKELCEKQGVYLIIVPYNIESHLIPTFIIKNLPESIQKKFID